MNLPIMTAREARSLHGTGSHYATDTVNGALQFVNDSIKRAAWFSLRVEVLLQASTTEQIDIVQDVVKALRSPALGYQAGVVGGTLGAIILEVSWG